MAENGEQDNLQQVEISSSPEDNSVGVQETAFQQEPEVSPSFRTPVHYAGFWMRFWAYLLDLIVVGSLDRLLVKPIFRFLASFLD